MMWLTSLSILLVIFSHQKGSEGRSVASPWTNPRTANTFKSCLMQNIPISSVFPQQEKTDLKSILQSMISAMFSLSSESRRSQSQAMDMAFASTLAEFMIADDNGNEAAINEKSSVLTQVVLSLLIQVMEEMAEENDIEVLDQYPSTEEGNLDLTTAGAKLPYISSLLGSSDNYEIIGGTSTYSTAPRSLSQFQTPSIAFPFPLASSNVSTSVIGAGLSYKPLSQITVPATQSALAQSNLSSSQIDNIIFGLQNSLLRVGNGAGVQDANLQTLKLKLTEH